MNGIVAAVQGRIVKDPDGVRYLSSGNALLSFGLAVNDDKRAEVQATEWVRVTAWGEQAEKLAETLRKGLEVYCEGRLRLKTWTKDGAERSGLELSAWSVQPQGAIGRRAPKPPASRDWAAAGSRTAFGAGA